MDVTLLLSLLVKYGPDVYREARKLLAKKDPTEADFAALDKILERTGESYFDGPKVTT